METKIIKLCLSILSIILIVLGVYIGTAKIKNDTTENMTHTMITN